MSDHGETDACKKLWGAALNQRVVDAIYPFKIPDNTSDIGALSLADQKKNFVRMINKGGRLPTMDTAKKIQIDRALNWLETDQLDNTCDILGYGGEFVNRTFKFCQEAVTYRKEIYSMGEA